MSESGAVARGNHQREKISILLAVDRAAHSASLPAAAITRDILDQLLATCGRGRAVDLRDRALLFARVRLPRGSRRSEIERLRIDDLEERESVPADPVAPEEPTLPVLALRLRRTKSSSFDSSESVLVVGRPVEALHAWLEFPKIDSGPVYRRIDKWGAIGSAALDPQSINGVVKSRCALAKLDPVQYSAHGLRSGYLAQVAREGVPLPEAMQQSQNRSFQQVARYYDETQIARGRGGAGGVSGVLAHGNRDSTHCPFTEFRGNGGTAIGCGRERSSRLLPRVRARLALPAPERRC